jgi:two-component system alkaline phosphatase synthesis response regulator PhoP
MANALKLLIVDDEPEIGELLSYNFRKRGFEVMTASNGYTALESMNSFMPDVVILDIMMPFMNGIKTCQEIKSDPKHHNIPVLFLSATNNEDLISQALEAGGDKFLSKPIHLSLLIDTVVKMQAEMAENKNDESDQSFN